MSAPTSSLASRLIRNMGDAPAEHWAREPLYESHTSPLTPGTAARKLSARVERVPPGKRSCPLAEAGMGGAMPFEVIGKTGERLPYWEGEP